MATVLLSTVDTSNFPSGVTLDSELGTAALLNVGVGANNIVKLDSSAKLPAVDGSQLTGIDSDVTSVFSRTGAITATASDYDASQVDNDSGVDGAFVSDALDALNSETARLNYSYLF